MKKSIISLFALAAMILGASNVSQAQLRWGFFIDGVAPVGSFASDVNNGGTIPLGLANMGKQASLGFGGGVRGYYRLDVGVGEVAPFVNLDLFWNSVGGGLSTTYADNYGSAPTYLNLPLTVGATYFYDELWNDITPFGELGIGPDWMIFGSEKAPAPIESKTFRYKSNFSLALMVGGGAFFGRHFSVGLYYYSLGNHTVDYTNKTIKENEIAKAEYDLNRLNKHREIRYVGEVALRVGFHF